MKKIYLSIVTVIVASQLFAGGIVTNTNQSAQFVRMLSRNASTGIDAVYFNPAGVSAFDNGFHLSFNNQSIFQTKTISTDFPLLNTKEFVGDVNAPLFPSFFAAYKMDKFAVSLGFGPNGGGGSAEFAKGLPSFEMPISMMPTALTAGGITTTQYDADIYFDGSSVYWGTQLNFSYEINEQFSVAAGVRMINAKNEYSGYLKNIQINPLHPLNPAGINPDGTANMTSAPGFFTILSSASYGAASSVQPLIDGGVPDLEYARDNGLITTEQYAQLTGGLGANYTPGMPVTTVQGMYEASGAASAATAEATSDIGLEVTQTGLAFTPILSAQYTPNDKLNIAVKYEFNTKLELTNDTKEDGTGQFTNDSTFRADIPAILSVGIGYDFTDKFRTQLSFDTYFDKQADWGGREDSVDNNMWSIAVGFEYDITDKLTGSLGYMHGETGVGDGYQNDISYSNSSNTIGLGVQYKATDKLTVDLGFMYVFYTDYTVNTLAVPTLGMPAYSTTYAKDLYDIGVGISYRF